jgi:tape measure domain-containing protein
MAVDDKVVAISFESSRFEQGVNRTISALEKLKAALHFPNAGKGLSDIDAAAKKVDLGHISRGVDGVKNALNTLRLVGVAVLAQLATAAVRAGTQFVKAFTLDPIKAGFAEYTTNLNAIQTILANTQAAGTNLKQVNATLKELNEYSDKTIYNFSQMAKNIGTFTAAGVGLDTATASIKGIANLAALSGSNAEQASTAMYQLSQAIAAGSVKLMDWNSVVNAGMGGTVFQRALAQTAEVMGTLEKGAVRLEGPMKNVKINGEAFRQSLSVPGKASWLTSDVLTATLKQFTGDLKNAELAAMGFNDAQIKAIQQTAKTAMHAATEVKTISQVFQVAKETAASGWAQTFQIIFGTFTEAKSTFTALSNAINGFINASADARNKVLSDWKALGGRTVLIEGIKNSFNALKAIIAPIKEAFRDIFPATTGKNLYDLTVQFRNFTAGLKPSAETIENLKRTFRGLFALLSIGGQLLSGIFSVFKRLFGVVTDGAGGFLNFTGNIGDFLVAVDQALKKGQHFERFFSKLGDILAVPAELIKTLSGALIGLFSGALPGTMAKQMAGLGESMSPLAAFINNLAKQWNALLTKFSDTARALQPAFDAVMSLISGIGVAIGEAASNINFEAVLSVIRTGLLAGIAYMLKNFFGKGSFLEQISKGFGGGILENISGSFKALQGSMVALQQNIKAKTLKEIAIAIALLAASVLVLSLIDPAKLQASLGAMAIAFGQLLGAMAILGSISKSLGFIKMPVIAAALILLAGAITALSVAVLILSRLSWSELAKGLGGVAVLLGVISLAVGPLSANSAGMIRAGIGITGIAIALNILALAVKQFAGMNLTELGKGLGAVAVGLGILAAGMAVMPKGMILQGAALIAIAIGLKILASVVEKFSGMDWKSIGKGLAGVAGSLLVIAAAMHLMPKGMIAQAAALLILSFALTRISDAVQNFGGMSLTEIAKGLGVLAGSLIILAGALYLMSGAVGGAISLGIAAAGLALLAPALVAMGKQSWESIIKGLVGLAGALTIIGLAGLILTPIIPSLLGLGAALLLIGGGLALAGAGIFLIATGLSALVVAAPAGVGILVAAFNELVQGIIEAAKNIVLGILEIAKAFGEMAPQFVEAGIQVFKALLDGLVQSLPMIETTLTAVVDSMVRVLQTNTPKIVQAGMDFIIAFLEGIKANVDTIVNLIIDIIQLIIVTIVGRFFAIFAAGGALLRRFTEGILSAIAQVPTAALRIITSFLTTIIGALGRITASGLTLLVRFVAGIISGLGQVVTAVGRIITSIVTGITSGIPRVVSQATNMMNQFVAKVSEAGQRLFNEGIRLIAKLGSGISSYIGTVASTVGGAARSIGAAIIDGISGGLTDKAAALYGKIEGIVNKGMGLIAKLAGTHSPSVITHEIGVNIIRGLVLGMDQTAPEAYNSAETIGKHTVRKFTEVFKGSKVMMEIGKFVMKDFAQGLQSGEEGVNKVWKELNQKLVETAATARKTIAEEQKKLKELMAADKQDAEAIKKSQDILKENQRILAQSIAGHTALTGALQKQKSELLAISKQYDMVSNSLKLAQEKLKELEQAQVDAMKSFRDQYATLPELTEGEDVSGAEQLANYLKALQDQTAAVAKYHETLEQLRALGLDDETYQKLLEEGTADQQFAEALLAGGETAVKGLNELDKQLKTESEKLAIAASRNLHQAGIDAASGLIKGLKSQKARLIKEMEDMADEIVAAFNRRLKIKSPSEVFAEVGKYVIQGFAKGISDSKKIVANALDDAAQAALAAMKSSMRNISDVVAQELNPNPVITPILDLTQIRTQAQELGALTNVTPITAAASYNQAALISAAQIAALSEETAAAAGTGSVVKFEQNNYSPESLTEIEIYRQTKNQLSQLKSALEIS